MEKKCNFSWNKFKPWWWQFLVCKLSGTQIVMQIVQEWDVTRRNVGEGVNSSPEPNANTNPYEIQKTKTWVYIYKRIICFKRKSGICKIIIHHRNYTVLELQSLTNALVPGFELVLRIIKNLNLLSIFAFFSLVKKNRFLGSFWSSTGNFYENVHKLFTHFYRFIA